MTALTDSTPTDTGTSSMDSTPADTGAPDIAVDAPTACNALTLTGAGVPDETSTDAHPVYAGGAIADGTYVLTRHVRYGATTSGPTGTTSRASLTVSGGSFEYLARFGGEGTDKRFNFNVTTLGSYLDYQIACPVPSSETKRYFYNATATTLEYCECKPGDPSGEVLTYTKL
jgi:hypothetical protein